MTSSFFHCDRPACRAITCLYCETVLEETEMEAPDTRHICSKTAKQELYEQLVAVLVEGSIMRCPNCKKAGQKDYACCHISCECGVKWCYGCAKEVANFSDHNKWNIAVDRDSNLCPMYLQYRWSGTNFDVSSQRYNGDAVVALHRFHLWRQREAVLAWEKQQGLLGSEQHDRDQHTGGGEKNEESESVRGRRRCYAEMKNERFVNGTIWPLSEQRIVDELLQREHDAATARRRVEEEKRQTEERERREREERLQRQLELRREQERRAQELEQRRQNGETLSEEETAEYERLVESQRRPHDDGTFEDRRNAAVQALTLLFANRAQQRT